MIFQVFDLSAEQAGKKRSGTSLPAGKAGLSSRVIGMKIKEFTFVNDCFQNESNEVFGVFLQRLSKLE